MKNAREGSQTNVSVKMKNAREGVKQMCPPKWKTHVRGVKHVQKLLFLLIKYAN